MRKKLILCFFLFLLVFSPLVKGEAIKLGLREVFELGLEKNLELQIARLKLENANLDIRKTQADQFLSPSRTASLQLESNRLQARAGYEQSKKQLILDLAQQYGELQRIQREKEIKRKQTKLEKETLEDWRQQLVRGYKTRLDLLKQENKYHDARLAEKKVADQAARLTRDFLLQIGLNADMTTLELEEIAFPTFYSWSEEEAVDLALNASSSLKAAAIEVELARFALERGQLGPLIAVEKKKLENNLQLALMHLEKTRTELVDGLTNQLSTLCRMEEDLRLNQAHLEIVKKDYQLVEQLKAMDLVNRQEQIGAEIEYLQAESGLLAAVIGYQLEKWKLQQMLGREPEVE